MPVTPTIAAQPDDDPNLAWVLLGKGLDLYQDAVLILGEEGRFVYVNDAATRALDRVLLWQHYSIPNWYLNYHRLAYRNRFAFVTTPPYTLGLRTWWLKPTENAR